MMAKVEVELFVAKVKARLVAKVMETVVAVVVLGVVVAGKAI